MKVKSGFVLNRNREASLEDSASVEGFLLVWGFNGAQWCLWWLLVAVGDGERAWDVGNGFGRKKEKEMAFFQGYTKSKG